MALKKRPKKDDPKLVAILKDVRIFSTDKEWIFHADKRNVVMENNKKK